MFKDKEQQDQNQLEMEEMDEDVKKERGRVLSSDIGEDVLQVKNLFKR